MHNSSGLIVISGPNQSLDNRSVSGWRNQVNCAAVGNRRNESLVPQRPEREGWEREKKKRGSFSSGAEDERWRVLQCCWRGGEGKRRRRIRESERLMGRWTRCGLHGSHSHLCGISAGLRRPLSCVWSRSLAGGRVGGGWQTEGEGEEEGREMRGRNFEMSAMTENELSL